MPGICLKPCMLLHALNYPWTQAASTFPAPRSCSSSRFTPKRNQNSKWKESLCRGCRSRHEMCEPNQEATILGGSSNSFQGRALCCNSWWIGWRKDPSFSSSWIREGKRSELIAVKMATFWKGWVGVCLLLVWGEEVVCFFGCSLLWLVGVFLMGDFGVLWLLFCFMLWALQQSETLLSCLNASVSFPTHLFP